MIAVHGVSMRFGSKLLFDEVSTTFQVGRRYGLTGPNGAGKSTLFNLVSGLLAPTAGSILLKGDDVTGQPPQLINRRGLSRSFQVTNIFHRMSVWENVRCALLWAAGQRYSFWRGVDGLHDINARTERILTDFSLLERREVPAGVLTYAEQRALEIAITIAGGADVILLDEPTAGMSRHEADRAVELIRRISEGRTLVIVEHDMSVVFGLADRVSVLVYGQIIASGTPNEIRRNATVKEAYLGPEAH